MLCACADIPDTASCCLPFLQAFRWPHASTYASLFILYLQAIKSPNAYAYASLGMLYSPEATKYLRMHFIQVEMPYFRP